MNCGTLERYIEVLSSGPVHVTIFGNRIFAHVIKIEVKMKSYWDRVDPLFNMTSILIRRESRDTDTPVVMEADARVRHLQTKECQDYWQPP